MAVRRLLVVGGTVQDGVLHLDDRRFLDAALKAWDGRVTVTIVPEHRTRSARANAYLWGVVYREAVAAFKEAGVEAMTDGRLHRLMKERHAALVETNPMTGEEINTVMDTHDMAVDRFSQFLEDVMLDLAQYLGIAFPEPRPSEDWRSA